MKRALGLESAAFFVIAFVLCLSVIFLINRLIKKRNQGTISQFDREFFDREIRTLVIILVIFSSTYILRGIWDIKMDPNLQKFNGIICQLLVGIICDFGPLMMLMCFHLKNFQVHNLPDREKSDSVENGSVMSQYETM